MVRRLGGSGAGKAGLALRAAVVMAVFLAAAAVHAHALDAEVLNRAAAQAEGALPPASA